MPRIVHGCTVSKSGVQYDGSPVYTVERDGQTLGQIERYTHHWHTTYAGSRLCSGTHQEYRWRPARSCDYGDQTLKEAVKRLLP